MEYAVNTVELTLPTGKQAEIREITGRAENIITDTNLIKTGKMLTKLLHHLVVSLDGEKPTEKEIQTLYTADRRAILLAARIETYGPELVFEHACINDRCPEGEFEVRVDLSNEEDIPMTPAPKDYEVEVRLPKSKLIAKIGPLTGEHETKMATAKSEDRLTNALLMYLRSIENVSDAKWREFLNNCSAQDTRAIREAAKNIEFGPETTVTVDCPHCGTENNIELTNEYNFFFPQT